MGFLLVLLLGFSPDASADNTGQTEALRVMRSDEQQLCTDLWACQAEALRRGVGAQVVNLINDARQAVARADEHPNDYSALQAAVLALGRDTDSCTLQVQSFTRPECRRDPFAGRTEPLTVHGFIGEDSKVCETRDMFPFQYHLSRRGRRYTAAIKLCMVPVDPPKEYADFFQRTHVSQSDGWGPITAGWKRELERFWRTDSGIHFRLDVNFVVASRRAECPAASDQIVDLVGKADRSNYTTWYLGDHGFDSGNGFYTLRHEIG
ncbi:MAG TPA: hypothetical protein VL588_07380, partial [Bdellovibrionota bacterium]|nr:hypothetical protein [Bdellovibrionota bacterium]